MMPFQGRISITERRGSRNTSANLRRLAECRIPTYGLTREEFQFCIRIIAVEADRLEFLLTGRDQE